MSTSKNPPTIIDLKTSFLRTQLHLLSTPLHASATFTTSNSNAALTGETSLRERAIDDALEKLNAQLKRHNKLVYAPQGVRHVAEQIDGLIWGDAGADGGGVYTVGMGDGWRERGNDLRDDKVIEQLPETYSATAAVARAPEFGERFEVAARRLGELSEKRRETKERLEAYRRLKGMVGAFGVEGEVQANLVTRNGAVERELERMRMLMLRVERGLDGLKGEREGREGDGEVDWEEEGERRLEGILRRE